MYDTLISVEQLNQHLDDSNWIIIDCRFDLTDKEAGYRDYLKGHIPPAVYADLEKDLSDMNREGAGRHPLPSPDAMNGVFKRLGIHADSQVVVYDAASGAFAARLWWMLRFMGHGSAAVLDGGWQRWVKAGYEIRDGENTNPPGQFEGKPDPDGVTDVAEVLQADRLIDSREPSRYKGESEPIDPVAGHIPGALNYFWKNNLDEDGNFGSGVTACHNLLAASYAGLPFPRLYVGSWSEWCADPERPVATGEEG
jgi:thiosulfate/3-mercaptopyruvate sulfurtransferase